MKPQNVSKADNSCKNIMITM